MAKKPGCFGQRASAAEIPMAPAAPFLPLSLLISPEAKHLKERCHWQRNILRERFVPGLLLAPDTVRYIIFTGCGPKKDKPQGASAYMWASNVRSELRTLNSEPEPYFTPSSILATISRAAMMGFLASRIGLPT